MRGILVKVWLYAAGVFVGLIMLWPAQLRANEMPFSQWLEGVRQEARSRGISEDTIQAALRDIQPKEKVVTLDRNQPEKIITLPEYLKKTVSASRIRKGRALLKQHHALLTEISKKYGVQPRFIVALWGVETNYGGYTGGFYIPEALATLAYDGRRSEYFRGELMTALRIIDEGHVTVKDMKGSWAGAMGQTQFMPSSFLSYAVDYDGDGKRDIWNTLPDVFASIANYLKNMGWNSERIWGRQVVAPENVPEQWLDFDYTRSLLWWRKQDLRRMNGALLPNVEVMASFVTPDAEKMGGYNKSLSSFLVYPNYKRLLRWNRSHYFALSVGHLSDAFR